MVGNQGRNIVHMDRAQRTSIGIVAALFLGVGAVGAIADLDPTWPQILLRAGIVLSALWIAAPVLRRLPRRVLIGGAVVAAVLLVRPRLIVWGVLAAIVAGILAGRDRR